MNELEAVEYVRMHAAAATHPTLSDNEISACLAPYLEIDGTYTDEGVLKATCEAWDIKTGKATDHHDATTNGRGLSARQVKLNCEERARWYRQRLPVHVA